MTIYVYVARTVQRVDSEDVDVVGEALMDALKGDPVLHRAEIAVIPGAPFVAFDVRAEVSANGDDILAVGCAFDTADESWKGTLEAVGLIGNIAHSQMSI